MKITNLLLLKLKIRILKFQLSENNRKLSNYLKYGFVRF